MDIKTDRAFVAADEPAVRYCTVTIAVPRPQSDVSLVIRDSMGARTRCLSSFHADADVDGLHIELGDQFVSRERDTITLVLATEISPKALGASTAILLRLSDADRVHYSEAIDVAWTAVDSETNRTQPVNRSVIIAAAGLLAERARAEALGLNRVGAYERANRILDKAVARIRVIGAGLRDVQGIANRLEDAAMNDQRASRAAYSVQEFVA